LNWVPIFADWLMTRTKRAGSLTVAALPAYR
jgi:hypothetical protein